MSFMSYEGSCFLFFLLNLITDGPFIAHSSKCICDETAKSNKPVPFSFFFF
ncbi:hypothetical protein SEVIR_8G088950v4 [Setaria viridis]